jgi:4,4'-diaponeurosporenoate glycosyltransferase
VVIPCRNERDNVGRLVSQLRTQRHPPTEIVVVDDSSSDDTVQRARDAGAQVVDAGPLPSGWVGKNWACHRGVEATTAPIVILLDADVSVDTDAIGSVVSQLEERGGLLSVAPWHTVGRPLEWLSMLFGIVSVMGVGFASPVRRRSKGAFGPCLALTRENYERLGGHEAVRAELVEDLALARRAERAGMPVTVVGGRGLVTYRMYPTGLRPLIEGWSKNIASGTRYTSVIASLLTAAWVAGLLSVMLEASAGGGPVMVLWLAAWVGQVGWMARQTGSFPLRSLVLLPVLAVAFVAIFVRSVVLSILRRRVAWRGREVELHTDTAPR